MKNTSESSSNYDNLEKMPVAQLLENINTEDKTVPFAVEKAVPSILAFMEVMIPKIVAGGRLFYIGAGTSGRLGILDASECPSTYGVPADLVIGIIAGGDNAIRYPVEFAEDAKEQAWLDLLAHDINSNDVLIGITASGTTPYVIGALQKANEEVVLTACLTCNYETPIAKIAKFPIEVVVGPEFVTGSTRMKAGTAQKLVLNMISTTLLIRLGHVKGNKMVDMQLSNNKLIHRGMEIIIEELNVSEAEASGLLQKHGSVRAAIDGFLNELR
jgi:N-acetylmuramic acid 6-phosphate etherase